MQILWGSPREPGEHPNLERITAILDDVRFLDAEAHLGTLSVPMAWFATVSAQLGPCDAAPRLFNIALGDRRRAVTGACLFRSLHGANGLIGGIAADNRHAEPAWAYDDDDTRQEQVAGPDPSRQIIAHLPEGPLTALWALHLGLYVVGMVSMARPDDLRTRAMRPPGAARGLSPADPLHPCWDDLRNHGDYE